MEIEGVIRYAAEPDISLLSALINSAYRGETSKKGWTTEADLLGGIRTDKDSLIDLINKPGSVLLVYTKNEEIEACVNLQKQGDKIYLGMLTVSPTIQAKGIGKKLLQASEEYAIQQKCYAIIMTVISMRQELIQWYERRGYILTGEKKPFPSNDPKFGLPKQELEFVVMKKKLS